MERSYLPNPDKPEKCLTITANPSFRRSTGGIQELRDSGIEGFRDLGIEGFRN